MSDFYQQCQQSIQEIGQRMDNIATMLENAARRIQQHNQQIETEEGEEEEEGNDPRELPRPPIIYNRLRRSPGMASLWGDDVTEEAMRMLEQQFKVAPQWEARSWTAIQKRLSSHVALKP